MTDFPHDDSEHMPTGTAASASEAAAPQDATADAMPPDNILPLDDAMPPDNTVPLDGATPSDNTVPNDDTVPPDNTVPLDDTGDADTPIAASHGDTAEDTPTEPPAAAPLDDTVPNDDAGHRAAGPPPPSYGAGPAAYGVTAPPIRRIYRSRHDRKLGGVSGGIAEFFHIDPTIVRLATLLLAFTGIGILVYFVAWIVIPLRPEGYVDPARGQPIATERNLTIAFGVAALALAFGIVTGSWAVLAIALVGGGIWLLSESAPTAAQTATPGYGVPGAPMAYAAPQPPASDYTSYDSSGGFPPPFTHETEPAPRERRPQRVTWIVLALLMLLTALGVSAAANDWFDVRGTHFLGIAVAVIAIGVVVGQIRGGGARGLIPLGILATLALFPVTAVDGLLDEGIGSATYRPTAIEELETRYEHGIGELTVDLSQLDFDGRSETIDIDLGIGELIVIVSEETGGSAALQARAGEVSHQLANTGSSHFEEGLNAGTGTLLLGGDDGSIELNIHVGLGTAELRTADS